MIFPLKISLPLSLIFSLFLLSCSSRPAPSRTEPASLQKKYSELLRVERNAITNLPLYEFITRWEGVPYQYAGRTTKGVDCSGLVTILMREVYGKAVSGSAASIYKQCDTIEDSALREGDLVFFRIDSKEITHTGVYLQNRYFVHASTKAGVIISGLDEAYYKKYFSGGGRLP